MTYTLREDAFISKEEGVANDNTGHIEAAGAGQQRGDQAVPGEIDGEGLPLERGAQQIDDESEQARALSKREEIKSAACVIESATDAELIDAGFERLVRSEQRSISYSGMLPMPESFRAYPEEVQERICKWNDAFTIDESKRQDKLVDNEIKQQNRASWMTGALIALFSILAFASFIITRDKSSFWLLSVPIANVVGNLIKPAFSRSSRSD